jgi:flagella basal body P-ring formation protein FlgA
VSALTAGLLMGTHPPDGKVATRSLAPGEPLRRDYFQPPVVLRPGDLVRVLAGGVGFAISTEGKALTGAHDGQTAQVALAGGRVVTGVARTGKVVEVR